MGGSGGGLGGGGLDSGGLGGDAKPVPALQLAWPVVPFVPYRHGTQADCPDSPLVEYPLAHGTHDHAPLLFNVTDW